jgi:phosphoribosylanthranilate isomerase
MRVKLCGITLVRDLRLAEYAGANYVGIVVEADSPRALSQDAAALLARAARLPAVLVTVDMDRERLLALSANAAPAALQLHGRESAEHIASLREALPPDVEIWRAVSLRPNCSEAEIDGVLATAKEALEAGAARIVLDARVGEKSGGTGQRIPVAVARQFVAKCPAPCVLAGGLGPDDLRDVWHQVRPWALDLSSKLERQPGIKDPAKMRRLAEVLSSTRTACSQEA